MEMEGDGLDHGGAISVRWSTHHCTDRTNLEYDGFINQDHNSSMEGYVKDNTEKVD